uniref:Uncharacterized protein n=1 Tax=Arundo donax TaxID=35708 RepID=A0A0A9EJZ2_ARUDO
MRRHPRHRRQGFG